MYQSLSNFTIAVQRRIFQIIPEHLHESEKLSFTTDMMPRTIVKYFFSPLLPCK